LHCTLDGLQPLLEEKFDSKVFATRAIQSQVVGETLKKLGQGIIDLNEEIRAQVRIHIRRRFRNGLFTNVFRIS